MQYVQCVFYSLLELQKHSKGMCEGASRQFHDHKNATSPGLCPEIPESVTII